MDTPLKGIMSMWVFFLVFKPFAVLLGRRPTVLYQG